MKKLLALLLAVAMVLSLVACTKTPTTEPTAKPTAGEPAAAMGPSSIAVCLASEPDTIDPALNSAVDGATLVAHLFSGLAKWAQDENGALVTAGGRVLGVTATAATLAEAVEKAYCAAEAVSFEDAYYRKDIGARALAAHAG